MRRRRPEERFQRWRRCLAPVTARGQTMLTLSMGWAGVRVREQVKEVRLHTLSSLAEEMVTAVAESAAMSVRRPRCTNLERSLGAAASPTPSTATVPSLLPVRRREAEGRATAWIMSMWGWRVARRVPSLLLQRCTV